MCTVFTKKALRAAPFPQLQVRYMQRFSLLGIAISSQKPRIERVLRGYPPSQLIEAGGAIWS